MQTFTTVVSPHTCSQTSRHPTCRPIREHAILQYDRREFNGRSIKAHSYSVQLSLTYDIKSWRSSRLFRIMIMTLSLSHFPLFRIIVRERRESSLQKNYQ